MKPANARYTPAEREAVLNEFLDGIAEVSYDVLREAVKLLRQDSVRLNRIQEAATRDGEVQLDFGPKFSRNLRQAIDDTL